MVTSAQEWEEHVQRGNTVQRAPVSHCHVHQEPTLTGWWTKILFIHNSKQLIILFNCVTVCCVYVFVCLHVDVCSLHLTDTFGCSPCPVGHFCGTPGLTRPSGLCKAGFYCPGGDTTATGSNKY